MTVDDGRQPRMACADEADDVARLLHDLHVEFGAPAARRRPERHGFAAAAPGSDDRALDDVRAMEA